MIITKIRNNNSSAKVKMSFTHPAIKKNRTSYPFAYLQHHFAYIFYVLFIYPLRNCAEQRAI